MFSGLVSTREHYADEGSLLSLSLSRYDVALRAVCKDASRATLFFPSKRVSFVA